MKRIIIPLLVVTGLFSCKPGNERENQTESNSETKTDIVIDNPHEEEQPQEHKLDLEGKDIATQLSMLYEEHMKSNSVGYEDCKPVLYDHLVPGLKGKLDRMSADMGAVALFQSQDPTWWENEEHPHPPVSVEGLGSGWYRVDGRVNLKAEIIDGDLKITYVSPDDRWGDGMIAPKTDYDGRLDMGSPEAFVKSLYDKYLYWYCQMPEDITKELDDLRRSYMTKDVLGQYDDYRLAGNIDSQEYDLFIGACDFEYLALKTLKIEKVRDDTFIASYHPDAPDNERTIKIKLTVGKGCPNPFYGDDGYAITHIENL